MSVIALDLLSATAGPTAVGELIAAWCKRTTAKDLSRQLEAIGCTAEIRTVNSWRQGHLPSMRHLIAMAELWGVAFLEDVFAPVLTESDLSLERRLERIEREAAAVKKELIDASRAVPAAGPAVGRSGRMVRGAVTGLARAVKAVLIGALCLGMGAYDGDARPVRVRSQRNGPRWEAT